MDNETTSDLDELRAHLVDEGMLMATEDALERICTFLLRYPEATVSDVMAEFDLSERDARAALALALHRIIEREEGGGDGA